MNLWILIEFEILYKIAIDTSGGMSYGKRVKIAFLFKNVFRYNFAEVTKLGTKNSLMSYLGKVTLNMTEEGCSS